MRKKKIRDPATVRRLTVSFSATAADWLDNEADKRSLSTSEMVRRLIDEIRGDRFIKSAAQGS
jgi:hypothetical protein